jgi:hypothetical protein
MDLLVRQQPLWIQLPNRSRGSEASDRASNDCDAERDRNDRGNDVSDACY